MSKKTIWEFLKSKGFSDVAAAAIMGNMEAESNCVSCRLQQKFARSTYSPACRKIFHNDTPLHAPHIISGIFYAVSLDSINPAD